MFSIGENYDIGDVIAGIGTTFGIGSITGISQSSVYGVSLNDTAFSLGATGVPIYLLLIILGVIVSYATNDGLSFESLMNRPTWEKVAAASTIAIPIAAQFITELNSIMLESYLNGTLFAIPMLIGYLIVGFRKANSKKEGLFSKVSVGN